MSPLADAATPGHTIDYWVAAVPVTWNIAPNGQDAIMGMDVPLADTVVQTVVYRRTTPHWRASLPNAPRSSSDGLVIPGPLLRARVGERIRIHFKNMDTLRREPHSMHFHGVHYAPSSDGAFVPGFSGKDANVKPGQTYTYRLTAGEDSAGVWPYHDHSPSMTSFGAFSRANIVACRTLSTMGWAALPWVENERKVTLA